ncbi:MAG TPA: protein translocase subunit SecF [Nitrospiraceae bacterium]|nr:protein translocase subunit SecF [Nitrospiraceae bacterium]
MFQLLGNMSIDLMRWRWYSFALSSFFAILGLVALVQISRGAANLGIDFSGGTAVQLKFEEPVAVEPIRTALQKYGLAHVELQGSLTDNKLMIRLKAATSLEEQIADRVVRAIQQEFTNSRFAVESTSEIGPSIGRKLQEDALLAILISIAGIVTYIALRFDVRFGVAAGLATVHDVLAVLGLFYVLDKEMTLLVVTALLTLAGYSLTDTVVVFDRIREHLRRRRGEKFEAVINAAVNQVLSRTVVVCSTVILVLIPLTVAGGEVLHDFSLALLLGVVIGTYSSIFVASPLLVLWPSATSSIPSRGST